MPTKAIRRTWFYPASWPIAIKLAFSLVLASLIPMLVVSYYNLQQGLEIAAEAEASKLEQIAASKGARLDQLIQDTQHTIDYFGSSEEAVRMLVKPSLQQRKLVEKKMGSILLSNANLESFLVLDRNGKIQVASHVDYYEDNSRNSAVSFRPYFKVARSGEKYVSDLSVGTRSGQLGMYFSVPVRDSSHLVIGVAVLKLKMKALSEILGQTNSDAQHQVFLVEMLEQDGGGANGVFFYPADSNVRFHSLVPLKPEQKEQLNTEKRFGKDNYGFQSFGLTELAVKMANARQPDNPDHLAYLSPWTQQREMGAFAAMVQKPRWRVLVSEKESVYAQPLQRIFHDAVKSVALVSFVFVILALVFARSFTRPLKSLTDAAHAVEKDDLENAMVKVLTRDELGRFAITFNHMVANIQARQRERDIFGRMVSPEVREKLLKGDLKLGGENLRVSVLFSDIRGFSTMSEKMSPQDVVSLLNEYLTEMTEAVRPYGGYINNFIGDAIVVIFGAPESRSECEWNALQAAMAMKRRLEQLNEHRKYMGDAPLATGIGISTGKVVAGQIGSMERFMYTVIGDTVNVAARLEALTKEFEGNPILMNAVTYEGCKHKDNLVNIVDEGQRAVKGRQEPVHVYAVYDASVERNAG